MSTEWATRKTFYNFQGDPLVEYWPASTEEVARANTEHLGEHAKTVTREATEWKEA